MNPEKILREALDGRKLTLNRFHLGRMAGCCSARRGVVRRPSAIRAWRHNGLRLAVLDSGEFDRYATSDHLVSNPVFRGGAFLAI